MKPSLRLAESEKPASVTVRKSLSLADPMIRMEQTAQSMIITIAR